MWSIFTVLLMVLTALYYYFTRNFQYWKLKGIPFEAPLPLFGNFYDVVLGKSSPADVLTKLYHKYRQPFLGIYILDKPFLVVKDPNIIREILIKNFSNFTNRHFAIDELADPLVSNALFGMKNPLWKILRNKLSPIFTSGKMKMMFALMKECGEDMQKYVGNSVGEGELEVKEICAKYTTDLISSCSFGIKAKSFENESCEFRTIGRKMFEYNFVRGIQTMSFFLCPMLVKIFKMKFMDSKSTNFLRNVFFDAIAEREKTGVKRNDFIDLLIQIKREEKHEDLFKLNGDRVAAQAISFFTAGHETSSSTMAMCLYHLCLNIDIQTKLRDEILEIINKHGDITYEAVQEMKYLHMVVAETLRLTTLAPFLIREGAEDYFIEDHNFLIEKGVPILIPLQGLHSDPKYFPNPETFDPERFDLINKMKIPSCVYMPFGEGPRNCIGDRFAWLTTKLGIIYFIKDFVVKQCDATPVPIIFNKRSLFPQSIVGVPMIVRRYDI